MPTNVTALLTARPGPLYVCIVVETFRLIHLPLGNGGWHDGRRRGDCILPKPSKDGKVLLISLLSTMLKWWFTPHPPSFVTSQAW